MSDFTPSLSSRPGVPCWLAVPLLMLLGAGCALDIGRDRVGVPLDLEAAEELEPGRSDLGESLEKLGAPHRIERENEADRTHLWWVHRDAADVNLRFQLPVTLLGYRHNVFQYFQGEGQDNTIHLVFDDDGQLLDREIHVAPEYRESDATDFPGRLHLAVRGEHTLALQGDAGIDDHDELFHRGHLAGIDVGWQPVAPLVFGLGLSAQDFSGKSVETGPVPLEVHDLRLYAAHLQVRVQVPLEALSQITDMRVMREVLLEEDPRAFHGWLLYVEGGVGLVYNEDVPVDGPGGRIGDLFDDGIGQTGLAGAGIEFSAGGLSLRLGGTYRTLDELSGGNTALDDDATGLDLWSVSVGLGLNF